jgi:hypothetical protein
MLFRSESIYIAHESTLNIKFVFVRKIKTWYFNNEFVNSLM